MQRIEVIEFLLLQVAEQLRQVAEKLFIHLHLLERGQWWHIQQQQQILHFFLTLYNMKITISAELTPEQVSILSSKKGYQDKIQSKRIVEIPYNEFISMD